MGGPRQIPQRGARTGEIPADEHGSTGAVHEVPGGEVVVDDEGAFVRFDDDVPHGIGRRNEAGDGVMKRSDQRANLTPRGTRVRTSRVRVRDLAVDPFDDMAILVVDPERSRRSHEADLGQVAEQGVHRRRPTTGRSPHGVADADDSRRDVAAGQGCSCGSTSTVWPTVRPHRNGADGQGGAQRRSWSPSHAPSSSRPCRPSRRYTWSRWLVTVRGLITNRAAMAAAGSPSAASRATSSSRGTIPSGSRPGPGGTRTPWALSSRRARRAPGSAPSRSKGGEGDKRGLRGGGRADNLDLRRGKAQPRPRSGQRQLDPFVVLDRRGEQIDARRDPPVRRIWPPAMSTRERYTGEPPIDRLGIRAGVAVARRQQRPTRVGLGGSPARDAGVRQQLDDERHRGDPRRQRRRSVEQGVEGPLNTGIVVRGDRKRRAGEPHDQRVEGVDGMIVRQRTDPIEPLAATDDVAPKPPEHRLDAHQRQLAAGDTGRRHLGGQAGADTTRDRPSPRRRLTGSPCSRTGSGREPHGRGCRR